MNQNIIDVILNNGENILR